MKIKFSIFFLLSIIPVDLYAGPGGQIAKELIKNPFVIGILIVLSIILSPILIFKYLRKTIKINKTKRDLSKIASFNKNFEWFNIKNRAAEVFGRVHTAWRKEDMAEAAEWMTHWYWQNQQIVFLDQWQAQGLINKCTIDSIDEIKPIYVFYNGEDNGENSRLVLSITANMEDYLMNKRTQKIVEGERGFNQVETYWTLILSNQKWLVENIEQPTSEYYRTANQLVSLPSFQSKLQHISN